MGWENRKGKQYYYRSVRTEDGTVRKLYLGNGELAHQESKRMQEKRKRRMEKVALLDELRSLENLSKTIDSFLEDFTSSELVENGFHNPQGRGWRKARK
jgi:hypothetical protein